MAKSSYEEQRAAELAYAEEYRRRLRRSRSVGASDASREEKIAEERAAAEAERAATVERHRSEAEARRRRTEELIRRGRVVTDPAEDLIEEGQNDEWIPIVGSKTPESVDAPEADDNARFIQPEAAPVSHNLHIEGMVFAGAASSVTAAQPTAAREGQGKGRTPGRGVVYEGYGFDEEIVYSEKRAEISEDAPDATYVDSGRGETDNGAEAPRIVRTNMEAKTRPEAGATVESVAIVRTNMEPKSRTARAEASPTIQRTTFEDKVRADLHEGEIGEEYDGDAASPEFDDSHLEEEAYSDFLKREKTRGVSSNSDPRDTYKPDYTAPEIPADEPDSREEPISKMDEEEAALAFAGYYREADKKAREGARSGSIREYTPEYSLDEKTKRDIENGDSPLERTKRDEEIDERELRREMERDMLEFVRSEERARKTGRTTPASSVADGVKPTMEIPPYDKGALLRMKKNECKTDVAMIEARIGSEISRIEAERDKLEFIFGEADAKNKRQDKINEKEIKNLRAKLKRARAFENADNDRYYRVVLTDLARARVPDKANMERVIELRERLMELLRRRDELNARLTDLYLGRSDKCKGGLEARAVEARKARRKEFKKRSSLAGRIKREKVAYDYREKLYKLMNEEVRLAGDIAECRYILRREKPKGEALRVVKKRLAELERDYKKNEKEIDRVAKTAFQKAKEAKEKKTGEVAGWIGLLILLAIIGVIIWQWEAISTFIAENASNLGSMFPPPAAETPPDASQLLPGADIDFGGAI